MLDKKLLEVLTSPPDAAVAIVTQGKDGPHVVNSWNSYAQITEDDKILFPAGRMNETEDWLMEPLREIWCGQDPKHGDKVFVYTLVDGRHYVDSIRAVECSELQDLECVVSIRECEQTAGAVTA